VALSGDAAHATSPHHGAGAGFCIEDAAVLATLLADPAANRANLPAVLEAYDAARRERGHWLVESSRHLGRMYDWQESMGSDMAAIHADLEARYKIIYADGAEAMCEAARGELRKHLAASRL
jgi:salicylate hydroxylase